MSLLRVQPIVEGHGEVAAVPLLVRRICHELFAAYAIDVLPPLRQPRSRLVRDDELRRFAGVAGNKLRAARPFAYGLVLVLIDGDGELPCELGPRLLALARQGCGDQDTSCVIANLEYETWFVAAASSLTDDLDLASDLAPSAPETLRMKKKWVEDRFRGGLPYSETLDQPRLTAKMNLGLCRERSPSFDKLCRELARALEAARASSSE